MKSIMSYIFALLGLVLVATVTFSCKTKQKAQVSEVIKKNLTAAEIQQLPKLLEYSKSPCYGTCPHFTMTVYQDGWTVFEGKRFTEKEGIATLQLNPEQLQTLLDHCKAADIWSTEKAYGMRIQDLPTTTVHLYEGDREKSVQWKMRQPDRLKTLDGQLMQLVTDQGWVAKRERSKDRSKKEAMPDITIDNELIVQIRDKIEGTDWALTYKEYGMQLKKPISKMANMYLFTFDTKTIASEKMLELVSADKNVARVEFNKRMQQRTR